MEKSKAITGMWDRRTDVTAFGTGIVFLRNTKIAEERTKNTQQSPKQNH
jgi:hypothetical protein